ncbi:endonuclease/exonuclease/phosphatase family protein [Candidatus Sumerlaeota bacterium]|nr:endonuclease/exonuclease/phosphatase family protein [Candidatus Sumerlaeota bacterium]
MNTMHFNLAICVCMSLAAFPFRVSGGTGQDRTLKVISYNVQFLPGPGRIANKRKFPEYRSERLGKETAKFDIVGLNETFDDEPRENIIKQWKEIWGENFHAVVHPRPDEKRFNGGLLIGSPLPIIEDHHTFYTHFSDPKDYGVLADGFAGKGVLHARILRGKDAAKDDYLDVFITHLEARADDIREFQYPEIGGFIKQYSDPRKPCLIMGDMNTHGGPAERKDPDSQYSRMIKNFSDARPGAKLIDLWPSLMGDAPGPTSEPEDLNKGSRIDYIFISNPAAPAIQLKPLKVTIDPYADAKVRFLSDHSAVTAEILWPVK